MFVKENSLRILFNKKQMLKTILSIWKLAKFVKEIRSHLIW